MIADQRKTVILKLLRFCFVMWFVKFLSFPTAILVLYNRYVINMRCSMNYRSTKNSNNTNNAKEKIPNGTDTKDYTRIKNKVVFEYF